MGIFGGKPDIKKLIERRDIKGLIKALKYKDADVREFAALHLGEIGDARAVEPLIHVLEGCYNGDVRKSVADALGKIGDTKATEPLIQALNNGSYDVWEVAKKVLEKAQAEKSNKEKKV